jgi:phospholipid/cholesterol/gamma-HCH transport system substrate-binding protein
MKGHTLGAFIKLVVFAVVTILATGVLAVVVSNHTFGSTQTYTADFTDAASLITGNDVRIAGVRVGTVKSVKLVTNKNANGQPTHVAQVSFTVDKSVPVTTTTNVDIRYQNLVGQRYLALIENSGSGQRQPTKQVISASRTAPALDLTQLFNGFRPLFQALTPSQVNSFASEIIATFQGESGPVTDLVRKTASLTNTIADRDAVIGQVVDNLDSVLHTVAQRDAGLSQVVDQLQRFVGGLAHDRNTIAASLGNIDSLADNSAVLLRQIRPALPHDLSSLSKVANSLDTTKDCPGYFVKSNDIDKNNVPAIPRFANNNCKGPNTLNGFLQREPTKLQSIIRTATYGSYFNFWLCDLELGGTPGKALLQALGGASVSSSSPACQR